MIKYCLIITTIISNPSKAQELFVLTEPASNMAAKSIAVRLGNYFMNDIHSTKTAYHLMPEVMLGINKKIMLHGAFYLSNDVGFKAEGGQLYAKYRFFSNDDIHKHFRMATFARYSLNNSSIHQPAIDFNGHSSGYELGIIATQLVNKFAISASSSMLHVTDNGKNKFLFGEKNRSGIGYSLAFGKLMLPKEYIDYKQTNLNLMLEFLGQSIPNSGYSFLDVAPSIQFIFNSRTRFDVAYRFNITETLHRTAPEGAIIKIEYNFFNALK